MSGNSPSVAEEIGAENAAAYLRSRGVVSGPATARELAGGISNTVVRVDAPEGGFVVKQALPVLRVEQRWEFDPRRIVTERRCLEALAELLPAGTVPTVVDYDDDAHAFVMTLATDGGEPWKTELMAGEVRTEVASRLGELLGTLQERSARRADLADAFDDLMPLEQGRIEPYHLTAAGRHPTAADVIRHEVARLRTDRRTLVLGDFSPKNVLAYPEGGVMLLDFEVAHWGSASFDPAFLISHLLLKAVHIKRAAECLVDARRAFWESYSCAGGLAHEADVATQTAVLLLCRVDGKSPADYLEAAERSFIRNTALRLLDDGELMLDDLDAAVLRRKEEQ